MKAIVTGFLLLIAINGFAQEVPELIPFRKGDLWGFSDKNRNVLIPAEYDNVSFFNGSTAKVSRDNKFGLIAKSGKLLTPIKYDVIFSFSEGLARFKEGKRLGYLDSLGNEVIILPDSLFFPVGDYFPADNESYNFKEGLAAVIQKTEIIENQTYTDTNGKIVLKPYVISRTFSYGYIDKSGSIRIPVKFKQASAFHNGVAVVTLPDNVPNLIEGRKSIINQNGKELLKPNQYLKEQIKLEDKSFFIITHCKSTRKKKGSLSYTRCGTGIYDNTLKEIVPPKFEQVTLLKDSVISVRDSFFKFGLVNLKTGKKITLRRFDRIKFDPEYETVEVRMLRQQALLDLEGNYIIPLTRDFKSMEVRNVNNYNPHQKEQAPKIKKIITGQKDNDVYGYLLPQQVLIVRPNAELSMIMNFERTGFLTDSVKVFSRKAKNPIPRQEGQKYYSEEISYNGLLDLKGNEIVPLSNGGFNRNYLNTQVIHYKDSLFTIYSLSGKKIVTRVSRNRNDQKIPASEVLAITHIAKTDLEDQNLSSCFYKVTEFKMGYTIVKNVCAHQLISTAITDSSGKVIIPFQYQEITKINEELVAIRQLGKWGVLDLSGKLLFPVEYDSVHFLSPELFVLSKFNLPNPYRYRQVINGKGEQIFEFYASKVPKPDNGYLKLTDQNVRISLKGEVLAGLGPEAIAQFPGLFKTEKEGNWGVIDYTGKLVMPFNYSTLENLKQELTTGSKPNCAALNNSFTGYPKGYSLVLPFSEGKAWLRKNGKYYIYKTTGELIATENFLHVGPFSDGLALVCGKEKCSYVNELGNGRFWPGFDFGANFFRNHAAVKEKNNYGLINKLGDFILPARFDYIEFSKERRYARKGPYWFTIDQNGNIADSSLTNPFPKLTNSSKPDSSLQLKSHQYRNNKPVLDLYSGAGDRLLLKNIAAYISLPCNLIAVKLPDTWYYTDKFGNAFYEADTTQHLNSGN